MGRNEKKVHCFQQAMPQPLKINVTGQLRMMSLAIQNQHLWREDGQTWKANHRTVLHFRTTAYHLWDREGQKWRKEGQKRRTVL
jgi:hypothetical protein